MSNPLITARDRFAADFPEERIQVNGRHWGVIRAGSTGPALVLIPGTLGRADIFFQQITALAGQCQILALSYPESGGIADWAADISELMLRFDLSPAVVLGSSLGGYLAQFFAATYPDQVKSLVAANTLASVKGLDQLPPYALDLMATPIGTLRAGFKAGLSQWLTPENPYANLAELLLLEVDGRIPAAEMRARLQALKTAPNLPRQTLPSREIYTVQSDDDHLISEAMRQDLRATLAPARAFRFTNASHFPYVTQPRDYTALLREILELAPAGSTWPAGAETVL